MRSLFLQRWPRLSDTWRQEDTPYTVCEPRQLERELALGMRDLSGEGLVVAGLDMALAGLMAELGENFFVDDCFAGRLTAAAEIMAAARVLLESEPAEEEAQRAAVISRLLDDAEQSLGRWEQMLTPSPARTLLYAAEEEAKIE